LKNRKKEDRPFFGKMLELWFIDPLSSLISILAGVCSCLHIKKQDGGTEKMQEISSAIKDPKIFL
jgi:Na+/H+-translocating membrane pyrophosphatase